MRARSRTFWISLGVICGGSLAVRLIYTFVFVLKPHYRLGGDAFFYNGQAALLSAGKGFAQPYTYLYHHQLAASADHPPLLTVVLAAADKIGLRSLTSHSVIICIVGVVTIVVVAVTVRRIAGQRAGIIAALLGALYPGFWIHDGQILSEPLAMLAVAVAVLFAYRFWSRPGLGPAIGVGVACGLGALSRSELVLLVPLLAAPLVLLARGRSIGRRLGLASIALLAAVATMAPWVVRNLVTFKQPVYLSTQLGRTLVYSNCNYVYYGPAIGSWQFFCDANLHPQGDESEQAQYLSHVGTTYIGHHLSRLPVVVAARVGRTWSVYDPIGQNRIDTIDGYKLGAIQLRLYSFYVLAAGAVVGVVMLRRHKVPVLPWISVALAVTVGVGVTYGSTRFRAPAEVAIVALAAVGADGMLSLRRSSRAVGSADTKTLGDAGMLPEMSSAGGRWMSSRD